MNNNKLYNPIHKIMNQLLDEIQRAIKNTVLDNSVGIAFSGGVDSSVVAQLLNKAIGKKLYCIFVNTGLLRKDEEIQVVKTFKKKLNKPTILVSQLISLCSKATMLQIYFLWTKN